MSEKLPRWHEWFILFLLAAILGVYWWWLPFGPRYVLNLGPAGRVLGTSRDGRTFATAALDAAEGPVVGPVQIWDSASGRLEKSCLAGEGNLLGPITLDGQGNAWVFRHDDPDRVKVLDASTGEELVNVAGTNACLSPDGRMLAFMEPLKGPSRLSPEVTGRFRSNRTSLLRQAEWPVKLWDVKDGRETGVLGEGYPLQFAPDGRTLVTVKFLPDSRRMRFGVDSEFEISLWNVAQQRRLKSIRCPQNDRSAIQNKSKTLFRASFSPDGETLAVWFSRPMSVPDATLELIDTATGRERARLDYNPLPTFLANTGEVAFLLRDPTNGPRVILHNLQSGQETRSFPVADPGEKGAPSGLQASPDGQTLVARIDYDASPSPLWATKPLRPRWPWVSQLIGEPKGGAELKLLSARSGSQIATIPYDGRAQYFLLDGKSLLLRRDDRIEILDVPPQKAIGPAVALTVSVGILVLVGLWLPRRRREIPEQGGAKSGTAVPAATS